MMKIVKWLILILLLVIWICSYYTPFKDVLLLFFLIFLNGLLFNYKNRRENIKYIIVFLTMLFINLDIKLRISVFSITNILFINMAFVFDYLLYFLLGVFVKKIFKKNTIFSEQLVIWLFTFVISQFSLFFFSKSFLDQNNSLPPITYMTSYFISGIYIYIYVTKNVKHFLLYLLPPVIIALLIILTSETFIKPLFFITGIMMSSSFGYFLCKVYHLVRKNNLKNNNFLD
ncbi:hypothetical protein CMU93_13440 [Elizabethkingia anophelis]|nr:hypothetical protein [Elizabethkingia anophelis]